MRQTAESCSQKRKMLIGKQGLKRPQERPENRDCRRGILLNLTKTIGLGANLRVRTTRTSVLSAACYAVRFQKPPANSTSEQRPWLHPFVISPAAALRSEEH